MTRQHPGPLAVALVLGAATVALAGEPTLEITAAKQVELAKPAQGKQKEK